MDDGDFITLHLADQEFRVVTVQGEVDVLTAPRLRAALEQLCAIPGGTPVIIDLTEVTFLSSSGLAVLADVQELAQQHSVELRIATGGSRVVLRPLQITGLSTVLQDFSDLAYALAAAEPEPDTSPGDPHRSHNNMT